MHHIVINYQQRRQYVLIFIASIIFSFGLGYWFGYNSNSSDDLSVVVSQIETLRSKKNQYTESHSEASSVSAWSPSAVSPAAIKPEAEAKLSEPVTPVKPVAKPVTATVAASPVAKPAPVVPPVTATSAALPATVKPAAAPAPVVTPAPITAPVTTSESITNTSLSAESANTQYAVQAGVFDSRENAMKLVNELNAKGFDAYVDEMAANAGEVKFNVRFGRSSDRDFVQKRLVRYKQLYTTAAYIITLDK